MTNEQAKERILMQGVFNAKMAEHAGCYKPGNTKDALTLTLTDKPWVEHKHYLNTRERA